MIRLAQVALVTAMLVGGAALPAGAASAQTLRISGTAVGVSFPGASAATFSVTGPDGFQMRATSKSGNVGLQLGAAGPLVDGLYRYEATAAGGEMTKNTGTLDNGRGQEPGMVHVGLTASGTFRVERGRIVPIDPNATEAN